MSQKVSFTTAVHSFTRSKIADNQQNAPKAMPCHVSKILPNDFLELTFDVVDSVFTLPKIQVPQAFSKYSREPTQVGDKGYVVPNDFSLSGESGQGGGATADLAPRGNLITGTWHPVSNKNFDTRDPNMFLVTGGPRGPGGPGGHTIQTHDKTTSTVLDHLNNIIHTASNGIRHTAVKDILHSALQNITHMATMGINHFAANIIHSAVGTITHYAGTNITHAVESGVLNLVQKELNIGSAAFSIPGPNDKETKAPPIPSLPAIVNLIGTLSSSTINSTGGINAAGAISAIGNITSAASIFAAGGMSAAGGMTSGGAPVMTEPVPPELVNARVNVNGDVMGNTALTSVIAALVKLGLITDLTTDTGLPGTAP